MITAHTNSPILNKFRFHKYIVHHGQRSVGYGEYRMISNRVKTVVGDIIIKTKLDTAGNVRVHLEQAPDDKLNDADTDENGLEKLVFNLPASSMQFAHQEN